MKYWHIYYDKESNLYKIRNSDTPYVNFQANDIGMFREFQMAYNYVCHMNGQQGQVSRWARR